MSELRPIEPFALDALDDAFRLLMGPWHFDVPETAPRIKRFIARK